MTTKPITWSEAENRLYEYGVSKGVLYKMDENGKYTTAEAWNGLTNVTDSPEGADPTVLWADGIEYGTLLAAEKYGMSIEAYIYPDSFAECDGSAEPIPGMYVGQQVRKKFGLCWRTEIGNGNTNEAGYKIHIAYGLLASPTEKSHDTVNDNPEAATFSWDAKGTPVPITGMKPSAKLEFDSAKMGKAKMQKLEELLYGTTSVAASLPTPDEILTALKGVAAA